MAKSTGPAKGGQASPGRALFSGPGCLWPILGWACFLGCSWTWVIGMVWPAMLLRDYGPWGWLAFAVPNVLGAGAMGLVLSRPGRSQRFVERHGKMAERFSLCTIGFHCFVLGWLMPTLFGWLIVPIVIVAALVLWTRVRSDHWAMVTAALVTLLSLAWLGIAVTGGVGDPWSGWIQRQASQKPVTFHQLLWLTPGLVVGFALCPYLDLTFHRARQATTPRTGMVAFGLGFGGIFLLMILGSLAYGPLLWPALRGMPAHLPNLWIWALAVHLTLQIALTTALHARELIHRSPVRALPRILLVASLALTLGALINTAHGPARFSPTGSPGESLYRIFLLAYGLVFPAYVWLCAIPTIRPVAHHRRRLIFIITLILALPLAYLVLVLGHTAWTLPVLGLLVLARLVVELSPTINLTTPPEDA